MIAEAFHLFYEINELNFKAFGFVHMESTSLLNRIGKEMELALV